MTNLVKVTTKQKDWVGLFNSNPEFRKSVLKVVSDIIDLEDQDLNTWTELTSFIGDATKVTMKSVPGLVFGETILYPVAGYGWDGGNPVDTQTFNLTSLVACDISGGPDASISKRKNPNLPGMAIHKFYGECLIQIF
jgi:hypothetical protein